MTSLLVLVRVKVKVLLVSQLLLRRGADRSWVTKPATACPRPSVQHGYVPKRGRGDARRACDGLLLHLLYVHFELPLQAGDGVPPLAISAAGASGGRGSYHCVVTSSTGVSGGGTARGSALFLLRPLAWLRSSYSFV